MLKDLMANKNYLNSLFTKNDFDFINSFDEEINQINQKIAKQEKLRDKIVDLINSISSTLSLNDSRIDNVSLYNLSNDVMKIFELVNNNITLLSDIGNRLNSLDSEIVSLLIDIEKDTHSENYYSDNINIIKQKIDTYSSKLKDINEQLLSNNEKIDSFLSNEETKKYLEGFNIVLDSPLYNNANNIEEKSFEYAVNEKDNNTLIISEKDNKVFLPYKVEEINAYLEQFPDQYNSFESVVAKEYILPLNYYMSHPVLARFREAYSLCRDKEAKPVLESLKYAIDMMFNRRINPAIIAACKTQSQLENYINCLEKNDLKSFTDFQIQFEITPL